MTLRETWSPGSARSRDSVYRPRSEDKNESHRAASTESTGPVGFLESRMRTEGDECAISMQSVSGPSLQVLFRQTATRIHPVVLTCQCGEELSGLS
jgi:hypothetical protein